MAIGHDYDYACGDGDDYGDGYGYDDGYDYDDDYDYCPLSVVALCAQPAIVIANSHSA